jgi:N-acetyl-anhydromuramyl-L-alanine amidase AmpD
MPKWAPRRGEDIDEFSIGIVLLAPHPGADRRWVSEPVGFDRDLGAEGPACTYTQYHALRWLLGDLMRRHPIACVVGQDEISADSKSWGPGPIFEWSVVRDANTKKPIAQQR